MRRKGIPLAGAKAQLDDVPGSNGADAFWDAEDRHYLVARALEVMQGDFEPTTWKACWAFVVEGRSAADVAKQLGTTVNAVYVAKLRVLRRLRQELNGLLD